MGDYPGLFSWAQCNYRSPGKREARKSDVTTKAETLEDARLLVGKIDIVSTSQECRQPLEGGKGREMDHSEPSEETILPTPYFRLLTSKVKGHKFILFKATNFAVIGYSRKRQ